jgi:tryptophan synthase beta chain
LLQDENGQVHEAHSISAGLDYPGVGPEHSYLMDSGRATYVARNDDDALRALGVLAREEGIIPALEPAHALAYAIDVAPSMDPNEVMLINISGRGDKDMETVVHELGLRG